MWDKNNAKDITRKCIKKYGRELFSRESQVAESIDDQLDELVAKVMRVDKELISVARQWRMALKSVAIAEGLKEASELVLQNEEASVEISNEKGKKEEIHEVNKEPAVKRKVELEILEEIQKLEKVEEITEDLEEEYESYEEVEDSYENMEDIRFIADSVEIMPFEDEIGRKFGQLEEYIKEKYSSSASLNNSIWAPKADACKELGIFKARVLSVKVPGDNAKQRERSIRWSLRDNKHIKEVQEKFVNSNLWCVIHFDCKKGYEEAIARLEKKKELDELNLILEENESDKVIKKTEIKERKRSKEREELAKQELAELRLKRGNLSLLRKEEEQKDSSNPKEVAYSQDKVTKVEVKGKRKASLDRREIVQSKEENRYNARSDYEHSRTSEIEVEETITVWDLPQYTSRTQVFNSIRHLGRIKNIEMIREGKGKLRAEVQFEKSRSNCKGEIWALPFQNECLVRVTPGLSKKEILEERKEFTLKLYKIPRDTNEILLYRQLKHTEAKAVHIFKNTNGNNKGFAVVSFAKKCDLERAKRYQVMYYNYKLQWEMQRGRLEDRDFNSEISGKLQSIREWRDNTFRETGNREYAMERNRYKNKKTEVNVSNKSSIERKEVSSQSVENREYNNNHSKKELRREDINMSFADIAQLMHRLGEKISNLEQSAPDRS